MSYKTNRTIYLVPWWLKDTLRRNKVDEGQMDQFKTFNLLSIYEQQLLIATVAIFKELIPEYKIFDYRDYLPENHPGNFIDDKIRSHAVDLLDIRWNNHLTKREPLTYFFNPFHTPNSICVYLLIYPGFLDQVKAKPLDFYKYMFEKTYNAISLYQLYEDSPYIIEGYSAAIFNHLGEQNGYNH